MNISLKQQELDKFSIIYFKFANIISDLKLTFSFYKRDKNHPILHDVNIYYLYVVQCPSSAIAIILQ